MRCTPMRVPTALQGSFDDRYVEIDDRDFTRLKSGITFHEISFSDFRTSIVKGPVENVPTFRTLGDLMAPYRLAMRPPLYQS